MTLEKFFTTRMLDSIRNRYINFNYFYDYLEKKHKFPPLSSCNKIKNMIMNYPNENEFHFSMKPELRESYKLPYMFSIGSISVRSSSALGVKNIFNNKSNYNFSQNSAMANQQFMQRRVLSFDMSLETAFAKAPSLNNGNKAMVRLNKTYRRGSLKKIILDSKIDDTQI